MVQVEEIDVTANGSGAPNHSLIKLGRVLALRNRGEALLLFGSYLTTATVFIFGFNLSRTQGNLLATATVPVGELGTSVSPAARLLLLSVGIFALPALVHEFINGSPRVLLTASLGQFVSTLVIMYLIVSEAASLTRQTTLTRVAQWK